MRARRFQLASQKMDAVGGWEAETIANQVYSQLGVLPLQDKLVENLSGGERKRLGLAAALVRKPDVILLDEVSQLVSVGNLVCLFVRVPFWDRWTADRSTRMYTYVPHTYTLQPTNHLDIDAIDWLEEHLRQRQVTAIVVTHDR